MAARAEVIQAWSESDRHLALSSAAEDERGAYVADLIWKGERGDLDGARTAVFALMDEIAQGATFVDQTRPGALDGCAGADGPVRFEFAMDAVAPDAPLAGAGDAVFVDVYGAL